MFNKNSSLWGYPELLLALVICFSPLLSLTLLSIHEAVRGNWDFIFLAVPVGRRAALLASTVVLGTSVSLSGMIIGVLAASTMLSIKLCWKAALTWILILFAVLPPFVHALSWDAFLSTINQGLNFFSLPPIILSGWIGSWWVQLVSFTSLAVGLSLIGFEAVSPVMIEVGRVISRDLRVFFRIVLPLAIPVLTAGGALLFLMSVTDYSVPMLFQKNVYTLEVFAEYSANGYPWNPFWLSLPFLLITFVVMFLLQYPLKKAALNRVNSCYLWKNPPKWPFVFSLCQIFAVAFVGLILFVPLIGLAIQVGSWKEFWHSIFSAKDEIIYSLLIGAITGIVSLLPAMWAADIMVANKRKVARVLWFVILTPLAVPPPLVGIGLITIWNRNLVFDVYGSSIMPVFAALARFFPLAVLIMAARIRQIDPALLEAARMIPVSAFSRWFRIKVPLMAPGLIASFCVISALTLGELGATLIVAPPGRSTLAIRIFNLLHYGAGESVASLCLLLVLIVFIAVIIGAVFMKSGEKLPKRRGNVHA